MNSAPFFIRFGLHRITMKSFERIRLKAQNN